MSAEEVGDPQPPLRMLDDGAWQDIELLLPKRAYRARRGRPRQDDRQVMTAILYRLRTGCAWKALPRALGAGSTVHGRFIEWREAGVFELMRQAGLLGQEEYEEVHAYEPQVR